MTVEQITSESIGSQIASAIRIRDADHTRLAADVGISVSTLYRFIRGTSDPTLIQMIRLSELLGYPVDWFMDGAKAKA